MAPLRPASSVLAGPPFRLPDPPVRRGAFRGVAIVILVVGSLVTAVAGTATRVSADATSASAPNEAGRSSSAPDRAAEAMPGRGSGWLWPVATPRSVVRPFDPPAHDYGAGHRGIDVGAEPGTTVVSAAPGVVTFAGPVAGRSVVTVDHGGGVVSSFDPVVPTVTRGTVVTVGTVLGLLEAGDAMHCADGCLHVGVRVQGAYVDPLPLFAPPERSVLLPLGR